MQQMPLTYLKKIIKKKLTNNSKSSCLTDNMDTHEKPPLPQQQANSSTKEKNLLKFG